MVRCIALFFFIKMKAITIVDIMLPNKNSLKIEGFDDCILGTSLNSEIIYSYYKIYEKMSKEIEGGRFAIMDEVQETLKQIKKLASTNEIMPIVVQDTANLNTDCHLYF
jgi:hypothetical protein